MFFTAQASTLLKNYPSSSHGNGTMVEKELDLGTLVIVDDQDEDTMDTMKSERGSVCRYLLASLLCRDGHR